MDFGYGIGMNMNVIIIIIIIITIIIFEQHQYFGCELDKVGVLWPYIVACC